MKKRHPHKENVLLVNITRLGDMLQATPTIAGMKEENPNCKVTVLVEKQFEEVCHWLPNIDEVVALDLGMTVRALAREGEGVIEAFQYVSEAVEDLKRRHFDYCLNMSSSAYTALLIRLLDIKRSGGWSSDEEGYRIIESSWAQLFATSVFHQNRQFNSLNLVDVFRASADVERHPNRLLMQVAPEAGDFARRFIAEAGFTNSGPLIAVQAGASQEKRQWKPERFVSMVRYLTDRGARVMLVGTKKELPIIESIVAGAASPNVVIAAGKTSIPQLGALLAESDVLVTGDTGPMHVSVAVGTPVVAMFLASAYGFETGPYGEGNLVLQPVIGCGPCNPNKPCSRPDCHDQLDPEVIGELALRRARGDVTAVESGLIPPDKAILYRSSFDAYGFYDLTPLSDDRFDRWRSYRRAYRRVWLDDLAGYTEPSRVAPRALKLVEDGLPGVGDVVAQAEAGVAGIRRLEALIRDTSSPPAQLGEVSAHLTTIDRRIEELGFASPALGPVTRMFCFAKENIQGSDPLALASQMQRVYEDLGRRCGKLASYLN